MANNRFPTPAARRGYICQGSHARGAAPPPHPPPHAASLMTGLAGSMLSPVTWVENQEPHANGSRTRDGNIFPPHCSMAVVCIQCECVKARVCIQCGRAKV